MTRKKNQGCGFYAALSAAITSTVLLGATATKYVIGSCQESEEKTPIYESLTPAQRESFCDLAITPLRESFIQSCNLENFGNGSVLKELAEQRNRTLQQYGCVEQEWECKPNEPSDLSREFKVEYRYK